MTKRKFLAFLFACLFLASCGKETEEKVADAILTANQLLSRNKCDKAIEVLENTGRRHTNGTYLVTLSSAYACRAGHSELTLFQKDLEKIGTPSELGSLTRFTTSGDLTAMSDSEYEDMKEAIEILLFLGKGDDGKNPSISERESELTETEANDLHATLMYEILVQLGRFLTLYGDPDTNGNKATGRCLIDYDNDASLDSGGTDISDFINNPPIDIGSCENNPDSGDPQMGTGDTPTLDLDVEKMCEGVVLMNNLINLLPTVLDAYSGDELTELDNVRSVIESARDDLSTYKNGATDVVNVTSFDKCFADNDNSTSDAADDNIQVYFLVVFEHLFP